MQNQRETGSYYEKAAAQFLQKAGYRIMEQNFRCRYGEIDLIAEHQEYLVFIEVKFRKNGRSGEPAEAVTLAKQRRICRTADFYLNKHQIPLDRPVRFDVAAVGEAGIHLIENAFEYRQQQA